MNFSSSNKTPDSTPQPVAYDKDGRPLYAAPPPQTDAPQFVHVSRAVSPAEQPVSDDVRAKHETSVKRYPSLNISEAEYVINEVRRHPIGLVFPVLITVFFVSLLVTIIINYPFLMDAMNVSTPPPYGPVALILSLLAILFMLGSYVVIWVYISNKFFLTNESVIQELQTSLFSRREQTVSLANIEDASYQQQGILQMLFNYGSIRLSTEGDETTYRFNYVTNPKQQIATLNNAVEAFKNGRPIEEN